MLQHIELLLHFHSFFFTIWIQSCKQSCLICYFTVYKEVEKRVHSFRDMLHAKLLKLPNTLEEQKKIIRFCTDSFLNFFLSLYFISLNWLISELEILFKWWYTIWNSGPLFTKKRPGSMSDILILFSLLYKN
jgi:hypothetical protein